MERGSFLTLATMLSLSLASCQTAVPPSGSANDTGQALTPGSATGTTLSVSIDFTKGLSTQALPGQSSFHHWSLEVVDSANTSLVPPITAQLNSLTGKAKLMAVPDGTGYKVKVNAFKSDGTTSVLVGGTAVFSTEKVNVANGAATYYQADGVTPIAGRNYLIVSGVTFLAGTDDSSVPPVVLPAGPNFALNWAAAGGVKGGVNLYNLASKRSLAFGAPSTISTYQLTKVQEGATSGNSHQVWSYAVDAANRITLAKPTNLPDSDSDGFPDVGLINVNIASPTSQVLLNASSPNYDVGIHAGVGANANSVYYYGSDSKLHKADETGDTASEVIANVTALAVDGNGVYYSVTGGNGIRSRVTVNAADDLVPVVDFTNTAYAGQNVYNISLDGSGNFYWSAAKGYAFLAIYKLPKGGDTLQIMTAQPSGWWISTFDMAVDAYGNVFSTWQAGANYNRFSLNGSESAYTPTFVASGANNQGLAIDLAGNQYQRDATGVITMYPKGAGGVGYQLIGQPTVTNSHGTLAVGPTGSLFYVNGAAITRLD